MLTRYKELDCWFRAKIQRLARAHWSHRALDPSEALCVNTLTHTLTQQCNYSQLRDTRQQPELHPICMACYFNSIITNLYGSYCFLQIQVTGDGQVRAVRASRVLKGMDLLNMNRHLYSGHMRSACDLLSQLTSLFTLACTKEIPIIDAWFCGNECAFAPDHCASQKVDTWESCSPFVRRSSRREPAIMQRLQHPDRHLISSPNPDGMRGLPPV